MAIHAALRHRTHYTYDRPVTHAPHIVRLRPAPHCRTRVLAYSMNIAAPSHPGRYRLRVTLVQESVMWLDNPPASVSDEATLVVMPSTPPYLSASV